jgi:ferric-dicitrate binding protein FerR (iron transport regulator)
MSHRHWPARQDYGSLRRIFTEMVSMILDNGRRRRMSHLRTGGSIALLALVVVLGRPRPATAQETAPCHVTRQVGTATLLHGAAQTPLSTGAPVAAGDRIVTNAGGRIEVTCDDGSTIIVGEGTNISLAIFQGTGDGRGYKRLLRLLGGILRLHAAPGDPQDRFDVITETAITSVRSTQWIVDAAPGKTAVFVAEGRVAVSGVGGRGAVLLAPGFGTDVAAGAAPTPPKAWGKARIDQVMARTTLP